MTTDSSSISLDDIVRNLQSQLAQLMKTQEDTMKALNSLSTRNEELVKENETLQKKFANQVPVNVHLPDTLNVQSAPTASGGKVKINPPKVFDGKNKSDYRQFLRSCEYTFTAQPSVYHSDYLQILFAISYLADGPQRYFQTLLASPNSQISSWKNFSDLFTSTYGDPDIAHTAATKIRNLKQTGSVAEYAAAFLELSSYLTEYGGPALKDQFQYGLKPELKMQISFMPKAFVPEKFDEFKEWVIAMDKRTFDAKKETGLFKTRHTPTVTTPVSNSSPTNSSSHTRPVPINVDATFTKLTDAERDLFRKTGVCFYCRKQGHMARNCPVLPKKSTIAVTDVSEIKEVQSNVPEAVLKSSNLTCSTGELNETVVPKSPIDIAQSAEDGRLAISSIDHLQKSHITIPVTLQCGDRVVRTHAMIDSGATGNFVNASFVSASGFVTEELRTPRDLYVVDGRPITSGQITHHLKTDLCSEKIHSEKISLYVTAIGSFPVILGLPWLRLHDPEINWEKEAVKFASEYCTKNCLIPVSVSATETIVSVPLKGKGETEDSTEDWPEEESQSEEFPRVSQSGRGQKSTSLNFSESPFSTPSISLSSTPATSRAPSPEPKEKATMKFVNAAALGILSKEYEVQTLYLQGTTETIERSWKDQLDQPASISATGSLSAEIAAREKPKEDPSEHPNYPRNIVPSEYWEYEDVFSKKASERLPAHRGGKLDHRIPLEPDTRPPYLPLRNMSQLELKTAMEYLEENLAKGWIRASTSSAGAPILFVKKKDGSLRFCVDYRGLNKITLKDRTPLPLIGESLDRLKGARYFTKIDLRTGYYNIRMAAGEEWKTAFRTRYGLYEYTVMPMGLTNAPATFQHVMNDIFKEYLDEFLLVYLDDLLIYSENLAEHRQQVKQVLQKLREHDLFAKPEKCEFEKDQVEYLGFVVSEKGVFMDKGKVKAIEEWEEPKSVHDVQVFLGFANFYRRFILNYSKKAIGLTNLLKKENRKAFPISVEARKSFETLKKAFITAPILVHFDPEKPSVLETDASDGAIAGILSQYNEKQELHPVAYWSRKMHAPEQNYDIGDKELLAMVEAIKHWRHYLEGAAHRFTIFTDHRNLTSLMDSKVLNRRQSRWALMLADYDFEIIYRPGRLMGKPDALSRRYQDIQGTKAGEQAAQVLVPKEKFDKKSFGINAMEEVNFEEQIRNAQEQDTMVMEMLPYLENVDEPRTEELRQRLQGYALENGLIYFNDLLYVPDGLRLDVLKSVHDSVSAGHFGQEKTFNLLTRYYWWPKCRSFVKDYVDSCHMCARGKPSRQKKQGLLEPLPIPTRPWESIGWDFIVELPKTENGNDSILTVIDRFSKEAHFIPCRKDITAEQLARLFLDQIYRLHGLPNSIISDRDKLFTSRFWTAFTELLEIKPKLSTAFHPESDGQTERTNATVEQYLRMNVDSLQDNWERYLSLAEVAYNNAVQSSTGMSPWYATKGYHPRTPASIDFSRSSSLPIEAERILTRFEQIHEELVNNLQEAQEAQKEYADQRRKGPTEDYQEGNKVWLNSKNIKTRRPCKKLDHKFFGPFEIEKILGPNVFRLKLPKNMKIHPVFHVSLLKPYKLSKIQGREQLPPPPVEVEGEEEYEVEEIVRVKRFPDGKLRYEVKWLGYDEDGDNTWEPIENLKNSEKTLQRFYEKYPQKPRI
jgi:transposase InsO family protein